MKLNIDLIRVVWCESVFKYWLVDFTRIIGFAIFSKWKWKKNKFHIFTLRDLIFRPEVAGNQPKYALGKWSLLGFLSKKYWKFCVVPRRGPSGTHPAAARFTPEIWIFSNNFSIFLMSIRLPKTKQTPTKFIKIQAGNVDDKAMPAEADRVRVD